jgi:type I restriction enzyme S subunit
MSARRAKPGYKLTPCGEIPQDWECVPLGQICREVSDRTNGDLPMLSVTKYNGFVPSLEYFDRQVFSRDTSNYKIVRRGQFAYSTIHLDEGSLGLLSSHDAGLISPMYTVFEPQKGVNADYLLALLKSPTYLRRYHSIGQGSIDRRKPISFEALAAMSIHWPPLKEQRRITSIIVDVDNAIDRSRATIEQRRRVRDSSVLARIQALRSTPVELGTVVESFDAGKSPSCEDREASLNEAGVLKISSVTLDGFVASENKVISDASIFTPRMQVREGDFLITRANTAELVGLTSVVEKKPDRHLFLSDKTLRLNLDSSRVDARFLDALLKTPQIREQLINAATGTSGSMKNIGQGDIRGLRVALPPLKQQKEIAFLVAETKSALTAEEQKLASFERVKTELSRRLLTGELRVKP